MPLSDKVGGPRGLRIIIGSGFYWCWFDALFMSVFFSTGSNQNNMAEIACIGIFLATSFITFLFLTTKNKLFSLLLRKRARLALALLGTLGSILLIAAGKTSNWPMLVTGIAGCALFMGCFSIVWGISYMAEGSRSATPLVSGAFVVAFLIDIPFLCMVPQATVIFFSLTPIASGALSLFIDLTQYDPLTKEREAPAGENQPSQQKIRLGPSATTFSALALIMICFGYMQHFFSYGGFDGQSEIYGVAIQSIRGVSAIALFAFLSLSRVKPSVVYRLGLLVMVAGFMLMSIAFDSQLFLAAGLLIIAGYTTFDVLMWVVFSQSAHDSTYPLKVLVAYRVEVGICLSLGAFVGDLAMTAGLIHELTILVGYMCVIAITLLLSSPEIWVLFRFSIKQEYLLPEEIRQERVDPLFDSWGLTSREKEVALILAQGRSQTWIADSLHVSINTVNSHVRHIYQKAGIHNRQELIDLVVSGKSLETGEKK